MFDSGWSNAMSPQNYETHIVEQENNDCTLKYDHLEVLFLDTIKIALFLDEQEQLLTEADKRLIYFWQISQINYFIASLDQR